MKVLIASLNNAKITGAKKALEKYYNNVEIIGVDVDSEVNNQPVNENIILGAKNRIKNLKKYVKDNNIECDYYMAIESGINNLLGSWMITNIAIIENNENIESISSSASFPVPEHLVDDIIKTDLNEVMNRLFTYDKERRTNGGGIKLLTHDEITRIDLTETAFVMALTKFINKEWK